MVDLKIFNRGATAKNKQFILSQIRTNKIMALVINTHKGSGSRGMFLKLPFPFLLKKSGKNQTPFPFTGTLSQKALFLTNLSFRKFFVK